MSGVTGGAGGTRSVTQPLGVLGIDPDALASCVSCGLCLAHCPTYRVSGEERLSPRGRIAAMRVVDAGGPLDRAFEEIIETCVQCRACETACPSSVPFGKMMEATRRFLAEGLGRRGGAGGAVAGAGGRGGPSGVPAWQRAAYSVLGKHRLLEALTVAGAAAQRVGLVPRTLAERLSLPRLPLRQERLRATGTDVWLFTGCVMDAWQRPVHQAAVALIGSCGAGVALPGPNAACCGALHVHAGLHTQAVRLARRVMSAFPGEAPILVDSAGCGAALKAYGDLLGTEEAQRFSRRVLDVHEWLAGHASNLPPPRAGWARPRVALQDPCHLRHVQRAESHVRTVLSRYVEVVELNDEGRCCGAGGSYSVLQPQLARSIRSQKLVAIEDARAELVASANPGCSMWLAGAGVQVKHPVEIAAEAAGLAGR